MKLISPDLQPSLRTLAMPADANPNGDIFGGWIISQMDLAGGTYAFQLAGGRVATVAITSMQFLKPVYIGDEVSCYCTRHKLGNTSIAIDIETWVRRRDMKGEEKVTEGLFTFVAIDDSGSPRPVAQRPQAGADESALTDRGRNADVSGISGSDGSRPQDETTSRGKHR